MYVVLCIPFDGKVEHAPKLVFAYNDKEEAERVAGTTANLCNNPHIVRPLQFAD